MGYKKKNEVKSKFIAVRMTSNLLKSLDKLVKLTGTNRSDVLRRLVESHADLR